MKNIVLLCLLILCSCRNSTGQEKGETKQFRVSKTEAEWKAILSDLEYYVLREAGTERPFSSPLDKIYLPGTYYCKGCNTPVFKSEHKFNSGTGWPSFDREIKGNVEYSTEYHNGYTQKEEHCSTCGGHLGHVFNDGPKNTTGKRHCINGAALKFVSSE